MSNICVDQPCVNFKTSIYWPCCSSYCYQNYKQDKYKLIEKQKCLSCYKAAEADQENWPFCSTICKSSFLELEKPIDRTNVCSICFFTEVTAHHEECMILCDDCAGLSTYTCSSCLITFKSKHNVSYCNPCLGKMLDRCEQKETSKEEPKGLFKIASTISSFVQATSQRFLKK